MAPAAVRSRAMDIEWEEPPAEALFRHANRGGKYVELAMALKEHPGRWAKFPAEAATTEKTAQSLAAGVRAGRQKGFTKGEFEAIKDGTTVYVRAVEPKGNGSDDDLPEEPGDAIDPTEVRAWARENGWPDLGPRGRIAGDILEAWRARPGAHLSAVKGH